LQDRDLALLRGLFESRLMTLRHAAALYFQGRQEAAKKRIQKLKAARIMAERPRRPYDPSILFLTRKAFRLLQDQGVLAAYPPIGLKSLQKRARVSDLTLRHELNVMDVKAAIVPAIAGLNSFKTVEFSTWPLLFQFKARSDPRKSRILIKPDGFIRIHEQRAGDKRREHTCFLEIDRSTETLDTLANKAACYIDYYYSGRLAARFGYDHYKDMPFRLLMVFRDAERRNNTAERLLQNDPPIRSQVWLTTMTEITRQPLAAIWIRPGDYGTITEGTGFHPERRRDVKIYRRRPEREALVEQTIHKLPLFEMQRPAVVDSNPRDVLT